MSQAVQQMSIANSECDGLQLPTLSNTQPSIPRPSTTNTQPTPPSITNTEMPLSKLNLKNYHEYKKFWPLGCIQQKLYQQKTSNHQISAAVIAEGQALIRNLDHSLHMIAMISGVNIVHLKQSLFSMPPRGSPEASKLLTIRNQAKSQDYQALTGKQRGARRGVAPGMATALLGTRKIQQLRFSLACRGREFYRYAFPYCTAGTTTIDATTRPSPLPSIFHLSAHMFSRQFLPVLLSNQPPIHSPFSILAIRSGAGSQSLSIVAAIDQVWTLDIDFHLETWYCQLIRKARIPPFFPLCIIYHS
ncbi:hypothetical protein DFH28DRAFT_1125848 [Melampsora americana]|nr:hypothetical protein DFH28DRAFT_1125848 [Melampsora americana]